MRTSAAGRERPARMPLAAAIAVFLGAASATAADEVVAPSRAELIRRWDLNKDGTIDESEAEIARANMRRERLEIEQRSATKSRMFSRQEETLEEEPPKGTEGEATPPRPGDPLAEAFRPGGVPSPKPADRKPSPGSEQPVRRRDLNAGRPRESARGMPQPQAPSGPITGGVRAGGPAVRPGYGAVGPKSDLNAGRLPTGLPPAQGLRPQAGAAPFRGLLPGSGLPRGPERATGLRGLPAGRPTEPPRPPLIPASPAASAEEIGLP